MSASRSRRTALFAAVVLGVAAAVVGLRVGLGAPRTSATDRNEVTGDSSSATPELAARAVDRFQRFRTGGAGERLALSADEVTAMLRHAMPGVLPRGISDPSVRLGDGSVRVHARLATADFVGSVPLGAVVGALPDTVEIDLVGHLAARGQRLVFNVESAHAGRVSLPPAAIAAIGASLADEADEHIRVAPDEPSLSVAWPGGVDFVAVVGDRIVLERDERMVDRAVDGSDDP